MANTELLKKVYLFDGFSDAEIKSVLEVARERDVIAGDTIFDEDAEATSLYLIRNGTVEITKKGSADDQRVATFSSGSHFGEMAFLDKSKRTAGSVVRENAKLLEIPYDALEKLSQHNQVLGMKLYRNFALTLCRRIRQTTMDLSTLKDLKLRHQ